MWSCGTSRVISDHAADTDMSVRSTVVGAAIDRIGSKYEYASRGPNSFDCSGLVTYAYRSADISIAGSSSSMSKTAKPIEISKAQAGDLIFFKKSGKVFHVSIVIDNQKDALWVVHSTSSRGVIKEDVLASSYWRGKIDKVISLGALINR